MFVILADMPRKNGELERLDRALGAHQAAHHMRRQGAQVRVISHCFQFSAEELYTVIMSWTVDKGIPLHGVGISCTFMDPDISVTPKEQTYLLFNLLKQFNSEGIRTFLGGPYAAKFAAAAMNEGIIIDHVFSGYCEDELAKKTREWIYPVGSIKALTTPEKFDITYCDQAYHEDDFVMQGESLPIEIGRGCIFNCKFCAYPLNGKKKLDYLRSPKFLAEAMLSNYEKFGTVNYMFTDDTFNESNDKLKMIADEITKLPFKISFAAYLRLDLLMRFQEEQLPLLDEIGLQAGFFGIETLNPESGKVIGKYRPRETTEQFLRYLAYDRWKDKHITCSYIFGLPYETKESLESTVEFMKSTPEINHIFSPLQLKINDDTYGLPESIFEKEASQYGYRSDGKGGWVSDTTSSDEILQYIYSLVDPTFPLGGILGKRHVSWRSITNKTLGFDNPKIGAPEGYPEARKNWIKAYRKMIFDSVK